ncbi:MAG: 30S ribosomal protein S9 [Deltaproteobacteria bacterium]|nr:30S ribosomal protein S9 [Candidatus Anaeroferrophillacea bacterium]
MASEAHYATGRRKSAVARVWMSRGNGTITVNRKPMEEYFSVDAARKLVYQPLQVADAMDTFDINVNVHGGGVTGQAGAVKHGITRALMTYNEDLRLPLKKAGFVTRDSRAKERKKYGQRGARARFQFSKR